jgi:hypothetical protein
MVLALTVIAAAWSGVTSLVLIAIMRSGRAKQKAKAPT